MPSTCHRVAAAGCGTPRHRVVERPTSASDSCPLLLLGDGVHTLYQVDNAASSCPCLIALGGSSCPDVSRSNPFLARHHAGRRTEDPSGGNVPVARAGRRQSAANSVEACARGGKDLAERAGQAPSTAIGVKAAPGLSSAAPIPFPSVSTSIPVAGTGGASLKFLLVATFISLVETDAAPVHLSLPFFRPFLG